MGIREIVRPAAEVAELGRRDVDSQMVVESRQHFLKVDRAVLRYFAQAICGADHLSDSHSAPSQEGAGDERPMVAAGAALTRGLRPNSPQATTATSLSKPR